MKKVLYLCLAGIFSLVAFAAGCQNQNQPVNTSFYAMNAEAAFIIPDSDKIKNLKELCAETEAVLKEADGALSVTNQNSYIAKFNAAEAGEKLEINETAYKVLSLAKEIYTLTDGYYNPAVYYNVCAYKFDNIKEHPQTAEELPKDGEISKYNELSDVFGEVEVTEENGKYYVQKPAFTVKYGGQTLSMKLDLGGIGKGYAVDKVNAIMDKYGVEYGYFNFGMSSMAFKTYSEKEGYNLNLINPRASAQTASWYFVTEIKNVLISTSADNVQYYEIDGARYCHVFNPKTGKPVQTGIVSATVIGGTAAEDDALTTAIMAMGVEKAVEFINTKLSDRKVAFAVTGESGNYFVTNIPAGSYRTPTADHAFFVAGSTLDEHGKIVLNDGLGGANVA